MNITRGLWRTWLVLTALFILFVAANQGDNIIGRFQQQAENNTVLAGGGRGIPIACSQARGKEGEDWHRVPSMAGSNRDHCWYSLPKFRKYYPEYVGVADLDLLKNQYENAGIFLFWEPRPWWVLGINLAIAFGFPLAVLALGWAVLGFFRLDRKLAL